MSFREIENKLKQVQDNTSARVLKVLAVETEKSVRKNFDVGGRPPWEPSNRAKKFRKKNPNAASNKSAKTLIKRGYLKNVTAYADTAANRVVLVIDPRARAYWEIHNKGGTIQISPRKLKIKKSGRGFASSKHKHVKTVETKSYTINIPKREFLNIPPEDHDRIISQVGKVVKL